jgi:nucleoside 2-deoxyribosyltransferase
MDAVWNEAVSPGIADAGYKAFRIDKHQHNNRIDDEIIVKIKGSKFLVADFTGGRGGVYFEAGFAMGLGKPVIWTVERDELQHIHFDNRQYCFITWHSAELPNFRNALRLRIEATIGKGTIH